MSKTDRIEILAAADSLASKHDIEQKKHLKNEDAELTDPQLSVSEEDEEEEDNGNASWARASSSKRKRIDVSNVENAEARVQKPQAKDRAERAKARAVKKRESGHEEADTELTHKAKRARGSTTTIKRFRKRAAGEGDFEPPAKQPRPSRQECMEARNA